MEQESDLPSENTRNVALRALASRYGLTPAQISSLRLEQLHLATNRLIIAPDEDAETDDIVEQPLTLVLDDEIRQALITWLVNRPDSANDHLFPGSRTDGLDTETIGQVLASEDGPQAGETIEAVTAGFDSETLVAVPRAAAEDMHPDEINAQTPISGRKPSDEAEPEGVSLEEIEALREQLAAVDEGWAASEEPEQDEEPAKRDVPPERKPKPKPRTTAGPSGRGTPERVGDETVVKRPPRPRRPAGQAASKPATPPRRAGVRPPESPAKPRLPDAPRVPRYVIFGAVAIVLLCCVGVVIAGVVVLPGSEIGSLVAGISPFGGQSEVATAQPVEATAETGPISPLPSPSATATPTLTETPSPMPVPTDTPLPAATAEPAATSTPVVIVVTATPTPEPPATNTPVPTNTPVGGIPEETETPALPEESPTPEYAYPAPTLLEPADGGFVPGIINILKWEPVSDLPLADNEWYAVRLIYMQQGQPVYQGDSIKQTEWRVPDRFFYQADGPALEYRWFVLVERKDGDTITQVSPQSEEWVFRWE